MGCVRLVEETAKVRESSRDSQIRVKDLDFLQRQSQEHQPVCFRTSCWLYRKVVERRQRQSRDFCKKFLPEAQWNLD